MPNWAHHFCVANPLCRNQYITTYFRNLPGHSASFFHGLVAVHISMYGTYINTLNEMITNLAIILSKRNWRKSNIFHTKIKPIWESSQHWWHAHIFHGKSWQRRGRKHVSKRYGRNLTGNHFSPEQQRSPRGVAVVA